MDEFVTISWLKSNCITFHRIIFKLSGGSFIMYVMSSDYSHLHCLSCHPLSPTNLRLTSLAFCFILWVQAGSSVWPWGWNYPLETGDNYATEVKHANPKRIISHIRHTRNQRKPRSLLSRPQKFPSEKDPVTFKYSQSQHSYLYRGTSNFKGAQPCDGVHALTCQKALSMTCIRLGSSLPCIIKRHSLNPCYTLYQSYWHMLAFSLNFITNKALMNTFILASLQA